MKSENISKTFVLGIPKNSMDFLGQKTKQFNRLFLFSVFALLVLSLTASFALADDLSATSVSTVTKSTNTTFTLSISGNSEWNIALPTSVIIDDGNNHKATLSLKPSASLNNVASSETVNVNVTVSSVDSGFYLGSQSKVVTIFASNTSNLSQKISTDVTFTYAESYCEEGKVGNRLEITNLVDEQMDNTNEWDWAPKDNIELTLRVRNNYQDDISAKIVYGIYDSDNGDFIWDTDTSETLPSKETTDLTLTFQVPVKDLSANNYRFFVKVYDDDEGEDLQCSDQIGSSFYKSITIKRDSHKVTLDNIVIPEQIGCGTEATITMEAFNIGKNDEKKVKIVVSNTNLNINQEFIINNLDKGDSKTFDFKFIAPTTANEGTYPLTITSYYYYDSNNENYRDSEVVSSQNIVLSGNCKIMPSDITIEVNPEDAIQSGGTAGQKLVVKASISNLAQRSTIATIKASGYEDWATLDSISPPTFSINGGTTQDVLFTLNVNRDVKGDQTFVFEVDAEGQKLKEQTVSVPITAAGFSGFGNLITSDNWYLWAIGAFNVILVVIIIIVAIRVAKK